MITTAELAAARVAWGNGKIAISRSYEDGGIDAARKTASIHLDAVYGYNLGPVLFKPTMASGEQTFRLTKAGALAYFVGHSSAYPLDAGFAIRGWRATDSVTAAEVIEGDIALWMGRVSLTDKDGTITRVDKSFGYRRDESGVLRIVLHHSSLPYDP
ncbi:phosphoribosyl-AMP cyclohydrolase [Rhodovulum sp. BSW8]|uniref:Phosphoribosyl-AMP cyclohydrolase n=1 Tax=Rhodovulum visakhapatnamense TaxID=364297 RepID=A0ABS1RGP3_9RHOB|nr:MULTISPECIES: phosphoribosyl-AMP cyclohydrolase [Rhodovulum]MBL3570011.1 phosphoribosyl-AMP cyclohydrolase [Rhodovulum visakhapatnamense]MBL3578758.1 phosphoribosyl-AMP cyclohydrolase [Rhodovulum visakhapatnamense]OLS42372.1 phosphoribosyl-AMP cyclohydrolase [Rhodovulum sulfidophilum]RBO53859.1 phosphoribosyl-AMP cyclohydrolase [Rhodovulum sp. BSW8]